MFTQMSQVINSFHQLSIRFQQLINLQVVQINSPEKVEAYYLKLSVVLHRC